MTTITFIGAGNMATSILGGLIEQGFDARQIRASARTQSRLDDLTGRFGIVTATDNTAVARGADVVVLAVKPASMAAVCSQLAEVVAPGTLVISVAAGITTESLDAWLGGGRALVRCMPNTPSLVGKGASGLYANPAVSDSQKHLAQTILGAVGLVLWVAKEAELDAVTAVSGSGPAYFFLLIEAMIDAGVDLGLARETARQLALQTARGAAELACTSTDEVAELRRRVTSPGGTTEQAINTFEAHDFRQMVAKAMQACKLRAEAMAAQLGHQSGPKP